MFSGAGFPELFRQVIPIVGAWIEREHGRYHPTILPKRDGPSVGKQGGNSFRYEAIEPPATKNACIQADS